MDTLLTILMFLGIYVVFPLLVATVICGTGLLLKRRAVRVKKAKPVGTKTIAGEVKPAHHPVKA